MPRKAAQLPSRIGKYPDLTFEQIRLKEPEYLEYLYTNHKKELNKQEEHQLYRHIRIYREKNKLAIKKATEEEKIAKCVHLLKIMTSISEVKDALHKEYGAKDLSKIVKESKARLHKEFEIEKKYILDIHLLRYEHLYHEAINYETISTKPKDIFEQKIKNRMTALDIMYNKEKLLGMHNKNFTLKLNNLFEKRKKENLVKTDTTKLTLDEKRELLALMTKMKKDSNVDNSYVEYEEVKDIKGIDNTKINDNQIDIPIKNVNAIEENKEVRIEDKNINNIEVFEKIKESMRKKIEETYKKKN